MPYFMFKRKRNYVYKLYYLIKFNVFAEKKEPCWSDCIHNRYEPLSQSEDSLSKIIKVVISYDNSNDIFVLLPKR